jgi:dinuclear metal center YbgI/SA1388 family protein
MNNIELNDYCKTLLKVDDFKDYCPNGLQVEGKKEIKKIISGVSANLGLIEAAIEQGADAIFVHHGFFWKNENPILTGAKRKKIALLLKHNINLFAFHLPLDAHQTLGNNAQLSQKLNISNKQSIKDSLVWQGEFDKAITIDEFSNNISQVLNRTPLVFSPHNTKTKTIKTIAWCTGGAQNYLETAIELGVDIYLTGEVSEQSPWMAIESNITFISAGHHATERYGVQALGKYLSQNFDLEHKYIEIDNIV